MTLNLFEATVESAEPQPDVSVGHRIVSSGFASLVAILPAVAAAITAFRISSFFATLVNAEVATRANVMAALHTLNTPLVVALGLSAFLAFVIALALAVDPKHRVASVGLPFSIAIPLVAFIPGLLLWSVETTMLALLDGKLIEGSVDEVAQRISLLLLSAMIWGVLAAGITLVSAVISLCLPVRGRTDALSLRRAFVWAVTGMLLLVFAGAYFIVV